VLLLAGAFDAAINQHVIQKVVSDFAVKYGVPVAAS
jgi:hypothetical protein